VLLGLCVSIMPGYKLRLLFCYVIGNGNKAALVKKGALRLLWRCYEYA